MEATLFFTEFSFLFETPNGYHKSLFFVKLPWEYLDSEVGTYKRRVTSKIIVKIWHRIFKCTRLMLKLYFST